MLSVLCGINHSADQGRLWKESQIWEQGISEGKKNHSDRYLWKDWGLSSLSLLMKVSPSKSYLLDLNYMKAHLSIQHNFPCSEAFLRKEREVIKNALHRLKQKVKIITLNMWQHSSRSELTSNSKVIKLISCNAGLCGHEHSSKTKIYVCPYTFLIYIKTFL